MIAQYLQVKEAHPDALLFYRMGDFYEMFFEDAEIGAAALGITLTKRGKSDGDDIPMCGVPVHRWRVIWRACSAPATGSPSASRPRIRNNRRRVVARGRCAAK